MHPAIAEVRPFDAGDLTSFISVWRRFLKIAHPFLSSREPAAQRHSYLDLAQTAAPGEVRQP